MKNFDTLGVMVDCSRNAVMTVAELKRFITLMAKMGYNQVQLYMEETYEVDNEKCFGYLRGRYSKKELRGLDDFSFSLGVELVPCIQTLAHMNAAVRWPVYAAITDIDDILLVGEERTYTLIDNMFATLRSCFRTDKIHIGMDEAHNLGRGKYLDRNGLCDRSEILLGHLKRVCELTDKYGFKPMMWSDMFYRIANGGNYYAENSKFDNSIKELIPENLSLVYWDYYHSDEKIYNKMLKGHMDLSDKIIFGGGAWKWSGWASHNRYSLRNTKAALNSCVKNGIRDVFMTCWGDNGAEASNYSVLPTLCYAACRNLGITKMAEIKAKFLEWTGYSYDDFMLLDLPDHLSKTDDRINPSKYGLYNDCFMGIFDPTVEPEDSKMYLSYARRLNNAAKRTGEFSYLFKTAADLCSLMALKFDIGVRTREVYKNGDKAELLRLIADYKKMIKRAETFYNTFKTQWFKENKPHGFDVQDIRLGGLIMRMKSCMDRLYRLYNGEITVIPELEEEILDIYPTKREFNNWARSSTANML